MKLNRSGRVAAALVGLAVLLPSIAWASHQFSDVSSSNPFHADIDALADAGIASGYPDGGFHPGAPVSRQAMAAFMRRSAPRFAQSEVVLADVVSSEDGWTIIGDVRIQTPASSASGTQFVMLSANVSVDPAAVAPECYQELCVVAFAWVDEDTVCAPTCTPTLVGSDPYAHIYDGGAESAWVTVSSVIEEPMGQNQTYTLQMIVSVPTEVPAEAWLVDDIQVTAHTAPFGWNGTDERNHASGSPRRVTSRTDEVRAAIAHQPFQQP